MAKSEAVHIGSINKSDLIRLAQRSTDRKTTFDDMSDAFNAIFAAIEQSLTNGNTVILPGIGRLVPIIRPGGVGRNPATGETIEYDDRLGLAFKINTPFKLALREVDIKSLGTGGTGVQTDAAGQKVESGKGGANAGLRKAVAGKGSSGSANKQTASTRPSRRA